MEKAIVNRVEQSGLINIDLQEMVDPTSIVGLDIKDQLFQGLILREKDFRGFIRDNEWSVYQDKHVAIFCSADAIVPTWAYMLIANKLHGIAKSFIFGSQEEMSSKLYREAISSLDDEFYVDQKVVIKGCGDGPVPVSAYVDITDKLRPLVKSLMFGEPCSTVPVYKKKK